MSIRHSRLMIAALGVSISAFAFAQNGQSQPGAGQSGTGMQGTGSSATQQPGQAGQSGTSGTGASGQQGNDGMGNAANTQTREMQRGQMGGGDADAKMSAQLDKIASMPDKAPDALFVLGSAAGNMWEVEFARVAQTKAEDQKVKELARQIEQDHSQANQRLQPIAQKMGLELPMSLPADKQKKLSIFQSMSAKDFETCYIIDNKAAHAKDITSYTDHQKSVKDEDLRRYVTETLPKLRQHGMHIQEVASSKGYGGRMMGGEQGGQGMQPSGSDPTNVPGMTNQSPDPRNPGNQQNPSDR